jgi:hypothetical protein
MGWEVESPLYSRVHGRREASSMESERGLEVERVGEERERESESW